MSYRVIDPDEKLDYEFDWTTHLGSDTITATGSTFSIEPSGPTLADDSIDGDNRKTTVFVSGCTRGVTYRLTNRIETNLGRTQERSFTLKCEKR